MRAPWPFSFAVGAAAPFEARLALDIDEFGRHSVEYLLANDWVPEHLPASYRRLAADVRSLPEPRAIEALRRVGVTYVVVHRDRFGAGADRLTARLDASPDFRQVAGDESVRLYTLVPAR